MILVTGATGNVGSTILDELSAQGVPCRGLTRDPSRARFPDGVEVAVGSPADRGAMESALDGTDAVFLNIVGDPRPTLEVLASGPPRRVVLLSSLTAGTRRDLAVATHLAELEAAVRGVAPQVCVLRPGQFASNVTWWRPMLDGGVVHAPFLDVALPPVACEDIGAVAAAALQTDAYAGQVLTLSGPALISPRQQVAAIAEVTGRSLVAEEISEDQFAESGGFDADTAAYLVQVMGHPTAEELDLSPVVADVTGRSPLDFETWVHRHRSLFV